MERQLYLLLALVLVCAVPLMQGCGAQNTETTTVKRTTVTTNNPSYPNGATVADSGPTTTTTTTTRSDDAPQSVLGATANAVETIILFPFRLLGDALGLLF